MYNKILTQRKSYDVIDYPYLHFVKVETFSSAHVMPTNLNKCVIMLPLLILVLL
jgi:hypothetical protein